MSFHQTGRLSLSLARYIALKHIERPTALLKRSHKSNTAGLWGSNVIGIHYEVLVRLKILEKAVANQYCDFLHNSSCFFLSVPFRI